MKRYRKIYKVIALFNSYHSLEGSDYSTNKHVEKAMNYCIDEINRLGYNFDELPVQMDNLIQFLITTKEKIKK